jgi:hypothetical protein
VLELTIRDASPAHTASGCRLGSDTSRGFLVTSALPFLGLNPISKAAADLRSLTTTTRTHYDGLR